MAVTRNRGRRADCGSDSRRHFLGETSRCNDVGRKQQQNTPIACTEVALLTCFWRCDVCPCRRRPKASRGASPRPSISPSRGLRRTRRGAIIMSPRWRMAALPTLRLTERLGPEDHAAPQYGCQTPALGTGRRPGAPSLRPFEHWPRSPLKYLPRASSTACLSNARWCRDGHHVLQQCHRQPSTRAARRDHARAMVVAAVFSAFVADIARICSGPWVSW
ncbi:uncharacterized protein IWZ02DRAFT_148865 [Phyllosticta citriasiana]|uniref:uncharacterized protein n=1 Tax=Phyllosticta citriasiana TaxID=595635 RepID=UPI0030FD47F8